ncbi:DUF4372 domain-containing protein [Piscinibacter sp.]|uniref:DUF4372 domain-containing protein n=1 Tax=Piscinibacter sp. TaxID=1903157 RepID=UPI002BA78C19|nr:DUF4372 domain-containing protein [Albitalea sp.]HUG24927.1 DUF4372 domain-containing protein [Albitalea sp.]
MRDDRFSVLDRRTVLGGLVSTVTSFRPWPAMGGSDLPALRHFDLVAQPARPGSTEVRAARSGIWGYGGRVPGHAAKGLPSWAQCVAMLFCQLGRAHSLREIEGGLKSCEGKLAHLGIAAPTRSSLSYANAHRPGQLFEGVFHGLYEKVAATVVRSGLITAIADRQRCARGPSGAVSTSSQSTNTENRQLQSRSAMPRSVTSLSLRGTAAPGRGRAGTGFAHTASVGAPVHQREVKLAAVCHQLREAIGVPAQVPSTMSVALGRLAWSGTRPNLGLTTQWSGQPTAGHDCLLRHHRRRRRVPLTSNVDMASLCQEAASIPLRTQMC